MPDELEQPEGRDRLTRWRLVLGGNDADGLTGADGQGIGLTEADGRRDDALSALYDGGRTAGLGGSSPRVARWLGDIRTYFPTSVVQVMQRDAIERLNLTALLLEPELLSTVQPDVHLVATLVGLTSVMPETTRETARTVVAQVVGESMNKRIPNGAWCLFRANPQGTRNGKIVVVQHRSISDPETGGSYTIKRYRSEKVVDADGGWRHERVELVPESDGVGFEVMTVRPDDADGLAVIAEWLMLVE